MADWDTGDLNHYSNDTSTLPHSRQSSYSSGLSNDINNHSNAKDNSSNAKDNSSNDKDNSSNPKDNSSNPKDDSSDQSVVLTGGENLSQESLTDTVPALFHDFTYMNMNGVAQPNRQTTTPRDVNSGSSGTAKARAAKSPYAPSTMDSIPTVDFSIPNDANISAFSKDQIANFLHCFNIDDRIISHLHRKNVDGKRFSRLKDSELENLNMKNHVITFFRDKSNLKNKKKSASGAWAL